MPSGKTHDKVSVVGLPILLGGLYTVGIQGVPLIIIVSSYMFASFMFNGDLDLPSSPYYRWLFLRFIWKPYQYFIPHRNFLSHGYIIGTLIRVLYVGIIATPILIYFNINIIEFVQSNEFLYTLIGLELGAALHSTMDYMF